MKFSLFLHVERYDEHTPITQQLDEMTELVQIAERGGFEAAWVGEHHGMGFTIAPNPFVNLAYLAAKTEKIRLGTGTVIAPFWHPIKLAGEASLPVFALGHSMGGLVTAASAARDPRGLRGVILSSPALLVGEKEPAWLRRLAPVIARLAPGLKTSDLGTGGLSRLPDEVAAYEADPVMYHGNVPALTGATMLGLSGRLWPEYARWTLPTLILHGTADRITDPRCSQRFHDAIASTDKTLHMEIGRAHV